MSKLTLALVAHDHKKPELLSWVKQHIETLKQCNLVATGTTGGLIADETGRVVFLLGSIKCGAARPRREGAIASLFSMERSGSMYTCNSRLGRHISLVLISKL